MSTNGATSTAASPAPDDRRHTSRSRPYAGTSKSKPADHFRIHPSTPHHLPRRTRTEKAAAPGGALGVSGPDGAPPETAADRQRLLCVADPSLLHGETSTDIFATAVVSTCSLMALCATW
ncbi:hypothetical protein FRAHR75_1970004 [Frankia sp. Hr75.2]|nr:hypothetical protein FRAHR75_1970004 [Frankia sp. Hr75.2]